LLPEFADLLPTYRRWLETANPAARQSVDAAVRAQADADAARSEADRFGDFLDELQEVLSAHSFSTRAYRGVHSAIQQIVQQVVENGAETRAAA
jgi:hypothetical protein